MATSWQPNAEALAQILGALHNITNSQYIHEVEKAITE